ncbi:DUF4192 domain-containing protein [Rhodococcus sp. X156]|uniref:DUF4192 domain-containing protein n=1 Tax=Rhodococcus sp. X156 TaxID=2499145 RepID=UPI000FD7C384|nr:DUF4192 domain-containing protein [Rhodococcus sp. X156]
MTTSADSPPSTIRIAEPGELIASLPALLGFVPQRSLVLLCLEGPTGARVGLVMRVDLPHPHQAEPGHVLALTEELSVQCARRGTVAVILVVVDDRSRRPDAHADLLAELVPACEAVGTAVLGVHGVAVVAAGAPWWSRDRTSGGVDGRWRTDAGVLPDPQSCPAAAAHVAHGRVIHGGREELDALLGGGDADECRRCAQLVDRALEESLQARQTWGQRAVREDLEAVLAAVARTEDGAAVDADEAARLGVALADPLVRDACFALAVGEHAAAAESLWLQLCRLLPAPEKAEPAVLVAYGCYVRGEGPLAGVALRAALEADPGHRMAGLLEAALAGGLRPEAVRELADTAIEVAADLGVTLPAGPSAAG